MSVDRQQRHLRAHPCPVCQGYDEADRGQGKRCSGFTSHDGWIRCSREEHAGDIEQGPDGLYAHRPAGPCRCGQTHAELRDEIEATYDYLGERGELRFQVVRKFGKKFLQRRPDGAGGWIWKMDGVERVPFRLPELLAAPPDARVWIVEGEKDVLTLVSRGLVATCNPGGAGKWHFVAKVAARALAGHPITIIADADDPGRKHAAQVHGGLARVCPEIQLVECPAPHKDVSDLLGAGGSLDQLIPMQPPPALDGTSSHVTKRHPLRADEVAARDADDTDSTDEDATRGDHVYRDDKGSLRDVVTDKLVIRTGIHQSIEAMATDAIEALADEGTTWERGHQLVRIIPVSSAQQDASRWTDSTGRPRFGVYAGTPIIARLAGPVLFGRLDSAALWQAFTEKDDWQKVRPDRSVSGYVQNLKHYPALGQLVAVTSTPFLRPDGTICQTPGYDRRTGFYFSASESEKFPAIPEEPTQEQAREAYARLEAVFADFPYSSPHEITVPIAHILTILARAAIEGSTPAFVYDAAKGGTGKTLETDVVSVVATGQAAARAAYVDDEAELRKMMDGFAMQGASMVCLDDAKVPIGGETLDRYITAVDKVAVRVLKENKDGNYEVPWRGVICITGNNVQTKAGSQMARRCVFVRLESPLVSPQDRTDFKIDGDLLDYVRVHRAELVAAALTILRAYFSHHCAGRDGYTWGSFPQWAAIIPPAIAFAGGPNVLDARRSDEEGGLSDDVEARIAIVSHLPTLAAKFGGRVSASNIGEELFRREPTGDMAELADAMRTLTETKGLASGPSKDLLAKRLTGMRGAVYQVGLERRRLMRTVKRPVEFFVETLAPV